MRKKYYIRTYGCQMNVSDAEKIVGWYEEKRWVQAKTIEESDEVVIVSCSVRESAENRVLGLINNLTKLKAKSEKRKTITKSLKPKIILTGCMMRYSLRWLREKMPAVDEFKKIDQYKVHSTKYKGEKTNDVAYVPISIGCNNFCSYCVVPYARGREVSRPFEEIVCEVEGLAKRGYEEIMLLGQNVNSYRGAEVQRYKGAKEKNSETLKHCHFATLLRTLHEIPGINKISFLTSNPWDLDDEIIDAMCLPKIDRYLHLPVQSGDDEILRRMNRNHTADDYLKLVEKIRKKIPDIKIGTDIIVGFPGETEEQFENTLKLCQKVNFVKAYVSIYSPRLQTAAYKMKNQVVFKEKRRRWKILDELINQKGC